MQPIEINLPFAKATFIPAGCIHWPIGEKSLLKRWVKEVKEAENGFTLLMGDSLDAVRTHYRKHLKMYGDDENSQLALDDYHRNEVRALAAILEPIKGRIKGIILGNHYWTYASGVNSEQYLADLLGVPYLGPMGLIRVSFRDKSTTRHQITIYAHHAGGSQGGRTTSGDVASLERAEGSFDADIYALSHTHRRYATRQPLMYLTAKGKPKVRERTKIFVRTGAFLKGYNDEVISKDRPHFPSYAEQKSLRPTDLGWVTVNIEPKRTNQESYIEYRLEY